jgi:hypothetical protein
VAAAVGQRFAHAGWRGGPAHFRRTALYAAFTRACALPHGVFTRLRARVRRSNGRRFSMLDLVYLALGLSTFLAFAFGIRAAERL